MSSQRHQLVSEGEVPTVDTIASEPIRFDDIHLEFDRLRSEAHRVFDVRDYERWLDAEFEPHLVDVGEVTMKKDMETLANDVNREEEGLLRQRAREVGTKIEEARDHVSKYFNLGKAMEFETQWRLREEEVAARERVVFEHQAAEAALLTKLNRRYGMLQRVPQDPFSWTVEWNFSPQEFTINVTSLRGLRGKQRNGYYVLLFSVVDRVGGSTVRFSTGEENRDCTAAIKPLRIQRNDRNVDRYINQKVELMCPASELMQTHAVLMVELWQLRAGKYDPVDEVCGFGYWPLVDQDHRVREGKFKVPLVVGEADEGVDTYRQVSNLLESGLQYWLGNLYFEISHLRRNREAASTSDRPDDLGAFGASVNVTGHQLRLDRTADDIRTLTFPRLPPRLFFDDVKLGEEGEVKDQSVRGDLRDMNAALWNKRSLLEEEKTNLRQEIVKRKSRSLKNNMDDDEEITEMRMRKDLQNKGLTKRKLEELYTADGDDEDKVRDSHVLIQHHHYALTSQREFFFMGRRFRDKLRIVLSVIQYDFGVNKGGPWDKSKVVINIIFLILGLLARVFVHGVAKYYYLGFLDVPLTRSDWNPWHVDIRFEHTSRFYPEDTLGTATIGFAICIFAYMFLSFILFLLICIFDKLPYALTRFAFWFGVATALDPIITSIAEAASGNLASGDPFLLYNQFQREEGTGVHGALGMVMIYGTMLMPHLYACWLFSVYVHLNGRAIDIYRRLTYPESSFFFPNDLEIAKVELQEIVEDAQGYSTEQGDIKRVHVEKFKHRYICLFRERLYKLLSIMDNNPDTWVNHYFDSIALRRPRWAADLIEDDLGRFTLGSDLMLFMKRHFPHLCVMTSNRVGDHVEDLYYESELMRDISSHSTPLEDDTEMRDFLKSYFMAQIYGEKPVEWSMEDPTAFIIKDKQLLADLVFFETSSDTLRSLRLFLRLHRYTSGYMSISADEPASWKPCKFPRFNREDPITSIEGKQAKGRMIQIIGENLIHTNKKELLRIFVVTPTGMIIEPTQSSFTYQKHHTADHIEFWAAKAMLKGKAIEEELAFSRNFND